MMNSFLYAGCTCSTAHHFVCCVMVHENEPRHEKTNVLHMRKQSEAVTAKLISAFVFRYIDSAIPLLSKSEISSL